MSLVIRWGRWSNRTIFCNGSHGFPGPAVSRTQQTELAEICSTTGWFRTFEHKTTYIVILSRVLRYSIQEVDGPPEGGLLWIQGFCSFPSAEAFVSQPPPRGAWPWWSVDGWPVTQPGLACTEPPLLCLSYPPTPDVFASGYRENDLWPGRFWVWLQNKCPPCS